MVRCSKLENFSVASATFREERLLANSDMGLRRLSLVLPGFAAFVADRTWSGAFWGGSGVGHCWGGWNREGVRIGPRVSLTTGLEVERAGSSSSPASLTGIPCGAGPRSWISRGGAGSSLFVLFEASLMPIPGGLIPLNSDVCDADLGLCVSWTEGSGCKVSSSSHCEAAESFLSCWCREATRGIGGKMGGAGDTGEGLPASSVRGGGGRNGECEVEV